MRLTAENIVHAIGLLPKDRTYNYINSRTKTVCRIERIESKEGPIFIKRWNPSKGETYLNAGEESISSEMIWRIANAFSPERPLNFDRTLGGSYNTRSVLETLMAYTPEFYYCYPGRIENISSSTSIQRGHKHLLWCPENPHEMGKLVQMQTDMVVSEMPNNDIIYDSLDLSSVALTSEMNIETKRRHTQMQIAIIEIGRQLGFRTYIAKNDLGITYKDKKIAEMDSVVPSLQSEKIMSVYSEAAHAARLIDCIWFKNGSLMPAVIEVEHSTGVTSGLDRMLQLYKHIQGFKTRYVVVAPDEDRERVLREANKEEYHSLNTLFFPYSAVEELYALCNKRKIGGGIKEEFLDCFMEPTLKMLA